MERTNVYLPEEQLKNLRSLGRRRGVPVAALIREALETWLEGQGVRPISDDEWQRRFESLLVRRRRTAKEQDFSADDVERDVAAAIREVRRTRTARRR
ncbi:MAG: ribbon-helix-helix domain-containing protein [Actinomycetota bacterium]|nr:ribbon-helix-helix domain-containing protein [Actinomycetota bacterium]